MILSSSSSTNSIAVIRRYCFCPTSKTSFSSFGNNKVSVYNNRYIQKQFHTSSTDASASDNTNAIHPSHMNVAGTSLQYKNLLVVIKQTAFEEYSQLKLRGQAPKALRWKRLESRYQAHKQCVTDLLELLKKNNVENFHCVNRVELDRQHLANIDLMIAVGGDGTVLSAAHFLDHGTIPLLGINSDPNVSLEESVVVKKTSDERRSHGALCMCTAIDMEDALVQALHGNGNLQPLTRIRCQVKGTFSETRLVPALNDLLIANPSPAAVSRYRMGWLNAVNEQNNEHEHPSKLYGTITRFDNTAFNVTDSINVWSSGMWVSTATGSTAAMQAAGGHVMDYNDKSIQYLIREHMIEQRHKLSLQEAAKARGDVFDEKDINNGFIQDTDKLHIRWNSQRGRIFIDGSHLTHDLELGDEILIDNQAPPLKMFTRIST